MRKIIVVSVVLLGVFAAVAMAQTDRLQPSRIATIKANVPGYLNERVRIDGFVTQFVDSGAHTTSFYYMKDDWGSVMKIRTSKQPPSVGKRYSIEGPVGVDPKTKDLYVSEETRLELFKGVEPWINMEQRENVSPPTVVPQAQETAPVAASAPPPQANTTVVTTPTAGTTKVALDSLAGQPHAADAQPPTATYVLIGGAAAVILAIVMLLVFRSRSDEIRTTDYSITTATAPAVEAPPAPEQVIEGRTIKLHAPPPNTVKLLPGWFEVLSGDEIVKQIRFYKLGGEHGAETTFGRATGRPYAHIQLKAPTVSSRQAKVAFDNGAARLTNFASTDSNPTRVNGRDLGLNETVPLRDSDRVDMGEVSLLFHEAQTSANVVPA